MRIALTQKVKVNSMAAGERLFVDLLPEGWSGVPPGLPQEVVEELAERAQRGRAQLKRQRQQKRSNSTSCRRCGCASPRQPTFTRYVFDLPDGVNVVPEQRRRPLHAELRASEPISSGILPKFAVGAAVELSSDRGQQLK